MVLKLIKFELDYVRLKIGRPATSLPYILYYFQTESLTVELIHFIRDTVFVNIHFHCFSPWMIQNIEFQVLRFYAMVRLHF